MRDIINKYLNIRNRNIIAIVIIILGIAFLINYSFFKTTYINEYIATNVYDEPANSYFDDDNFYKCVIDAYNDTNRTRVSYTTNLTNEQLQTIDRLVCSNRKITSTKGIEKLTKLTILSININQLTSLDVSNNTLLTSLDVSSNQLTNLDVNMNISLTSLDVSSNQLTSLNVSKNLMLEYLYVSNNQLTSLDVSKNVALEYLYVSNNQLASLDLSYNTSISSIRMNDNAYSEKLYVYKGEKVIVGNNIKIPSHLNWNSPTWTSDNTSVVAIDENGLVTSLAVGIVNVTGKVSSVYTTTSTVNIVEIISDKYVINEYSNYIFIGSDDDIDSIKSNIDVSDENVTIDVDLENDELRVKYGENVLKQYVLVSIFSEVYDLSNDYIYLGTHSFDMNNIIIKNGNAIVEGDKLLIKNNEDIVFQYDLIGVKINNYNIMENKILLNNEISYEDFISNIETSEGVIYKLFNGEEELTSGNVSVDFILKIYYNNNAVYEYVISNEYLEFDESLDIDEDNTIINNVSVGTNINSIKNKINTSGNISVFDKDDNVITNTTANIRTGDKFKIEFSRQTLYYIVSVRGDINGDGQVNINDVIGMSKHVVKGNVISGTEYINASDVNDNGNIEINDVIKLAKHIIKDTEL